MSELQKIHPPGRVAAASIVAQGKAGRDANISRGYSEGVACPSAEAPLSCGWGVGACVAHHHPHREVDREVTVHMGSRKLGSAIRLEKVGF